MISIDYLSDLGLKSGGSKITDNFNIVIDYDVDETSSNVIAGDLLTFVTNNVKKAESTDIINAIALESGVVGETIKCQIFGVVNIPNNFISGMNYYNNSGMLSASESTEYIGLAITKDELLLKEGVFIHA